MRSQRAKIIRNALREHGNDTVREIDRISPRERLAIHSRTRFDIVRHIGDRDPDDVSAGIIRRRVELGVHGVVVVLGVRRIDRHERHTSPIFTAGEACRPRSFRFVQGVTFENSGDAMCVDGDQADRPLTF